MSIEQPRSAATVSENATEKNNLIEISQQTKESVDLALKKEGSYNPDSLFSEVAPTILPDLDEGLNNIQTDHLEVCKDFFEKEKEREKTNPDDIFGEDIELKYQNSYSIYKELRKVFSNEQINLLIQNPDNRKEVLQKFYEAEQKNIQESLSSPENKATLEKYAEAIKGFFKALDVDLPRGNLPGIRFLGKVETMLISSKDKPGINLTWGSHGRYQPVADGVLVYLDEDRIKPKDLKVAVHEILHSMPARTVKNKYEKDLSFYDHEKASYVAVGFASKNVDNSLRSNNLTLNNLNEGTNELFTRLVLKSIDEHDEHKFGEESYDGEVVDTEALIKKNK